jgi:hypothetical protein
MSADFEVRLAALEVDLAETKHQLARAQAVTEIQNVIARYTLYHSAGWQKECLDLFAMRTEDVGLEIAMWGQFWGPRGIYQNYVEGIAQHEGDRIGWFCEHPVSTPLIEVAGDAKTAKCIWSTFGPETAKMRPEDEWTPNWMYGKFSCDFILENGHWKMWHFQVLPDIMCPTCEPFTKQKPHDDFKPEDMPKPDAPTTFCEEYDVNKARKFWPQPPQPYETFEKSKKISMVKPTPEDRIVYDKSYNDFSYEEYLADLEARDPWRE